MNIYFLTILFAFYSKALCILCAALFLEENYRSVLLNHHYAHLNRIGKTQTKEDRDKWYQDGIEFINNFEEPPMLPKKWKLALKIN
ncbi:hypothetical protein EKK58_08520 [Candidatus Dependentiae bacterium]|nr:MAG: hypothetical protein EKK58_08520 [Candidatus Dependentiae bacterium]